MNGICFKFTETEPGILKGVCINPKAIQPDDVDDMILARMVYEAGMQYRMELKRAMG